MVQTMIRLDIGFLHNVPWARVGLYLFLSTLVLGNLTTALRRWRQFEDGYSRKLNHVGIMTISFPLFAFLPEQQLVPTAIVASTLLTLIYAVAAVSKHPLIFGIISGSLRKRDAPRTRFFFFFPLITFNLSLLIATLWSPMPAVMVAFLTVALADGLAEPVGLWLGKNNGYVIRDPVWNTLNKKSLAGSSAVCAAAFGVSVALVSQTRGFSLGIALSSALYAALVTFIEALSPRGMDNMLLMALCPVILSLVL